MRSSDRSFERVPLTIADKCTLAVLLFMAAMCLVGACTGCAPSADDYWEIDTHAEDGEVRYVFPPINEEREEYAAAEAPELVEKISFIRPNNWGVLYDVTAANSNARNNRCSVNPKNYTQDKCVFQKFGGPGPCVKMKFDLPWGTQVQKDTIVDAAWSTQGNQGYPHTCWWDTTGNDYQVLVTTTISGSTGKTNCRVECPFPDCTDGNTYHAGQCTIRINVNSVYSACAALGFSVDGLSCQQLLRHVVVHEFMHARGLGHTTAYGTDDVMYFSTNVDNWMYVDVHPSDLVMLNQFDVL